MLTVIEGVANCAPPLARPLLGREADVRRLLALLRQRDVGIITLIGPGGVGKTQLAFAAAAARAAEIPDGMFMVSLAPIADPGLVLDAIARAMHLRDAGDRPLAESLIDALRDRCRLLLLDNFEHLLPAAPGLAAVLDACPDLVALVTSRSPLGLGREHRVPVSPLALPPRSLPNRDVAAASRSAAVALFIERARQVTPAFALTPSNAEAVCEICRRLDGLPLAIELAAAWMRLLPPEALLARLDPALPLLSGGPTDRPARLRTMHGAIAWSHALLSPEEQRLFRRLAVFVGGFTLEGAAAVGGVPSSSAAATSDLELVRLLAALVDASLVQQADDVGGAQRYAMLETVREFASEQLAVSGERRAVDAAMARFILRLAETAEPHLLGPDELRWHARVNAELGNIRAALAWATEHDPAIAIRIGAALWNYWFWQGLIRESLRWLSDGLGRGAGASADRARAMTTAAAMLLVQANGDAGERRAAEAVAIAGSLDEPTIEARAWYVRAGAALLQGRLNQAAAQWDRALDLFANADSSSDRALCAYARAYRGLSAALLGDHDAAIVFYEDALVEARRSGSGLMALLTLDDFAGLLLDAGDTTRARALAGEALRLAVEGGVVWPVGHVLFVLAAVDVRDGRLRFAALRLGAAEELLERSGVTLVPPLQQRIDRTAAQLAARLRPAGLAQVRAQGRADPVAVIAQALADNQDGEAASGRIEQAAVPLSTREFQILALLARGMTDREIAIALNISRKTVSNHVASILAKLGVKTRTAAAAIAIAARLV